LGGAVADYAIKCGEVGAPDVAFKFTTDAPHDIRLTASGLLPDGTDETASVALRGNCDDSASEIACSHGFPGEARARALPAGTYFAIASSRSAKLVLDAAFDPPTKVPTNVDCSRPLDINKGGHFSGDFVDVGDDLTLACGYAGSNDLVYSFTTTETRDVEILAIRQTGERMSFAIRTKCTDADTTLRCVSDAPARAQLYRLPAGKYYLVLEGSPSRAVDFDLDVEFSSPTDPPPGDGCFKPIELPLSTKVDGTLANRQDLVPVLCRCDPSQTDQSCDQYRPDVTYHVKIDHPTDLELTLQGAGLLMDYDFRSTCDAPKSQLSCDEGPMPSDRIRNIAPGDYYLVVESTQGTIFTLVLDPMPLTVPVAAGGNDTCTTAVEIPPTGGVFSGDTLNMQNDYEAGTCSSGSNDVAFHLSLTSRATVTASVDAQFDSVLYRFSDMGAGASSCQSGMEAACNDDSGQSDHNSLLSELLPAGSYYYIVDGFGDVNAGKYLFAVTVTPQ
jgi:hypothetical protein